MLEIGVMFATPDLKFRAMFATPGSRRVVAITWLVGFEARYVYGGVDGSLSECDEQTVNKRRLSWLRGE